MLRRKLEMWCALCAGLTLGLPCTLASAQGFGASAVEQRPIAATNDEDPTAAASVIDLQGRPLALETLEEVIPEVPGAFLTQSGGYGSFSTVALRGTQADHTVWLLGDVPLNSPESGSFDLSTLQLPHFEQLEVYRGGAPAWYSQGSIAGVVRLVPRQAETTGMQAELGFGSFGRYEFNGGGQVRRGPVAVHSSLQVVDSDGDYPFVTDNGTVFDPTDDGPRRVPNNDVLDGSGLLHASVDAGPGRLEAVLYGVERVGGVQSRLGTFTRPRRSLRRSLGAISYTQERHDGRGRRLYRLQALASLRNEERRLYDPLAKILPAKNAVSSQRWRNAWGRLAGGVAPLPWLELTSIASYRLDRFRDEASNTVSRVDGERATAAIAGEVKLAGRLLGLRSELRASVRGQWSPTALQNQAITTTREQVARDNLQRTQSYRAAIVVEPLVGLSLRASFSTGQRLPTVEQLLGDGVATKPNPTLTPERALGGDAGMVLSGRRGMFSGQLQAHGYLQALDDRIALRINSPGEFVFVNVDGRAWSRGLELGLSGRLSRHVRLTTTARTQQTRSPLGLQFAREPKLTVQGRVEGNLFLAARMAQRLTAFATLEHRSTAFADPANKALLVPRTIVGVGVLIVALTNRLQLSARLDDLFDVGGRDLLGLPLPGRRFAVALTYREETS